MKLKLLLFLTILGSMLYAQEPYRSLIITEARMESKPNNYFEITNMGSESVQLNEFKFGRIAPWGEPILDLYSDPWISGEDYFFLPDKILAPGESYVIAGAYDFGPRQYKKRIPGFEGDERPKQIDIYDVTDLLIHYSEVKGDATDSITQSLEGSRGNPLIIEGWHGRECWYLEHHFAEGDSAVVDQVNGVFDNDGNNQEWGNATGAGYDVAGVAMATRTANLVRKYKVKTGNLDFANARGVGSDDSEWIPLVRPDGISSWRDTWWTVGSHGPYVLDANTLESDVIDVDFTNKTLTVPWGVRRLDGIMRHMVKKPGIAWEYHLNPNREDSLFHSAQTGDKITIYVCGEELTSATFDIIVSEPTNDVNIVVPIDHIDIASVADGEAIRTNTQRGSDGMEYTGWPRVTKHVHGTDTITGSWHGLPHALRTDSLMKYLEKPANATWEFVWVDGVARPDLKNGDQLKVTAQNGASKEYFIQVQPYGPSHNGYLAAITWPDIPAHHRPLYNAIYGWKGDTIAGFNSTTFNYRMQVPADVSGIPALVAKPQDLNATVEVKRATSLTGTLQDRTVSFIVTAEDDSVTFTYNVELVKEKDLDDIQKYYAEPFLSEFVNWDQWNNSFAEICNPGTEPLDLSNYMIVMQWTNNPADAVAWSSGDDEWEQRYNKYIPGYKWVNETQWSVTPAYVEQDLSVNPIVQPGDVFCMGDIRSDGDAHPSWLPDFKWQVPAQLDVQFANTDGVDTYRNPWGEHVGYDLSPVRKWRSSTWFLFKIKNDSIKLGLKPANNIEDFELIEIFGMGDGSEWTIGGWLFDMTANVMRKPEIYQGNPVVQASFGTTPEDAEWTWTDRAYWQARNVGWPMEILNVGNDIGQHFLYEPTHYKSTVTSVVYKVSDGYSMEEEIRGITAGTTVGTLLSNLNKAHEDQSLTVKSGDSDLTADDLLSQDDVLVVLSADSTNTTQYYLQVSEEGLSSDAVLTSTLYEVAIENEPKSASSVAEDGSGYITGFEYGTQLRTVLNNVTIPMGATLSIIDGEGAYVPLTRLNFDTAYVNVTVNANTYFEVVAENGITRIVYQLQPRSSQNDAFILSDIYLVSQSENLVNFVPRGSNVQTFLSNIVPSLGATVKLVDKMGFERTEGELYEDDKVVVTSPNGLVTRVYHLSMLRTQYILESTYLAYILSNIYSVDQVNYIVEGPSESTPLSEFYSRITASMGATAIVVDAGGNEKTSGNLAVGDKVQVTSADGKIVVDYQIDLGTYAGLPNANQIEIYPNPTNGRLNIRGAEQGNRIQVFNANGAIVRDLKVRSSLEVLSIDDQPAGMYLILISTDKQLIGRYKAIKN
ncbi:T9SS type A sorting domain-containing protein [Mariniphaga sp.]|uniref:T9SS type A sorting domain-containing protein n=1 Tax=Mariniphaga sp. TaxID=1954475 RepID=UPI0035636E93